MRWTSLYTIGFLALSARGMTGQEAFPVDTGAVVRISAASASGTYTVMRVDSAALVLRGPGDTTLIRVPAADVVRLSVRQRRSPRAGAVRGAMIGFGIGAPLGSFIGLASGDDECPSDTWCFLRMTAGAKALVGGVVLGLAGLAAGAAIGQAHPGNRWEPVVLRSRVTVVPLPRGRLGVAITHRL